jgi:hypothetical protein
MADRVLTISWGAVVRGAEERGLEVFNEALGLMGQMQQDGRIESFHVVLMSPDGDIGGYIEIQGSAEQIASVRNDEAFLRNTIDADLVVENLRHGTGYTNEGIAKIMGMYQEAIAKIPQRA